MWTASIIAAPPRRETAASPWRARRSIAFLDSDDLWSPAKLERQLAFMRDNPGCAISQTNEIWLRNGRRVNPAIRHRKRAGDIFIDSLRTCLIGMSSVMIRTDLFRSSGGFDELMTAAEDYDLWLRILIDYEAGLLDEPLVTRRGGRPDQLSAKTPALDRFRILALAKLLADDRLSPARRTSVVEVLAEKMLASTRAAFGVAAKFDEARLYEWVADQARGWDTRAAPEIGCAVKSMRAMLRVEAPYASRNST